VVPEIEAEYPNGAEHMTQYLRERVLSKIDTTASNKYAFVTSAVRFTVNESGEIANAQIISGSLVDPKVNQLLLDAIHNMPKWKPAENAKGMKVKQEFELSLLGRSPGGC
jgi:TonB family protein